MLDRKGTLGLAVCAALATAGLARGGETLRTQSPSQNGLTLSPIYGDEPSLAQPSTPPADAAPAPAPDKPLMAALKAVGVGTALSDAGINLYGFVEGGWTYAAGNPPGDVINGYIFNTKSKDIVLDQLDFNVEKTVDAAAAAKAGKIDFGGHLELQYGWDAGLIHSNGLYDNSLTSSGTPYYRSRFSPENQFDVTQAYLDLALPVGTGLRIRAGKFVTLLGQETINPTGNALYSHSFLFGFAIPFTETGVVGTYALTDSITIDAGVTRGWNQSINDNNGAVDFLGRVTWAASKSTNVLLSVTEGPEAGGDNSNYWTVVDLIVTHTIGDNLTVAVNADYGDAPHALGAQSAQWYGVAGYLGLKLDSHFTINARGEWYDDNNGFTTGIRQNLYEATLGVAITPFPDDKIGQFLVFRPEVRYDYSDRRFFDGATDHYQFTAAIDAIFSF